MKTIFACLFGAALLTAQPAPQLSISVNGGRASDVPRGWPVVVRMAILHSQHLTRGDVSPLRLAPPGISWADAIAFDIALEGKTAAWDLKLAAPPDDQTLVLDGRTVAECVWRMSPDATAVLQPGRYRLTARLEIKNSDGWNGLAQSAPVTISMVEEPSPLPSAGYARKQRLRADYALAGGAAGEAEAILDGLLKSQPKDVAALSVKARLLELKDEIALASIFAQRAVLAAKEQNPDGKEPPKELLDLRSRLWTRLMTAP